MKSTNEMRPLLVVFLVAGCSSRASEPPIETGAFRFEDVVTTEGDTTVVRVHRREVPLEQLPLAPFLAGLPMSGNANIDVDLEIPIIDGAHDARLAKGTFAISCPDGCAIGDGVAKLMAPRTQGLSFGRIAFDQLEIRGEIQDAHVELTRWHAVSKDVVLELALTIDLAEDVAASKLDGCVQFRADPSLASRDPTTAGVLATTGANADAAGMFHIAIAGTVGNTKRLARLCGEKLAAGD